jgi:HPt (histidine-containing phosphotransfer) domain-containing protein
VVDLSTLVENFDGDPEMVRRFAFKFVETARPQLAEMEAALAQGDLAALAALGHRCKSSARTVGGQRRQVALCQGGLHLRQLGTRGFHEFEGEADEIEAALNAAFAEAEGIP